MESLGELLRNARERRNFTLRQVADDTRISLRYLEALESGQYRTLPGGMYNRAFLRSYAECIGLDPQKAIEQYETEIAAQGDKAPRTKAARPVKHREPVRLHPLMIWSVMLLFSIAGLYLSRNWISAAFSPYFAHRPPIPEPSRNTTPPPAQPVAAVESTAGTAPRLLQNSLPVPPQSTPASAQEPTAAPPSETASPSDGSHALRIEFDVLDKCWVSVNSDGTRVLVRLLEPGAHQTFDASERFYIVLGNAGGVRLRINGRPARPLGKLGEVVRVLITTQNISDFLENPPG
jgi:cytoskeletal protein RodZ